MTGSGKGILGIQDLTKIPCENRENDKYLDEIRDLTAPQVAGSAKFGHGMQDFFACLLGIQEIATTQTNVLAAKAAGVSFETQVCLVNSYPTETVGEYFVSTKCQKVYVV